MKKLISMLIALISLPPVVFGYHGGGWGAGLGIGIGTGLLFGGIAAAAASRDNRDIYVVEKAAEPAVDTDDSAVVEEETLSGNTESESTEDSDASMSDESDAADDTITVDATTDDEADTDADAQDNDADKGEVKKGTKTAAKEKEIVEIG